MLSSALADTDHDGISMASHDANTFGVNKNVLRYLKTQAGIDAETINALDTTRNLMPPHMQQMLPDISLRMRQTDASACA